MSQESQRGVKKLLCERKVAACLRGLPLHPEDAAQLCVDPQVGRRQGRWERLKKAGNGSGEWWIFHRFPQPWEKGCEGVSGFGLRVRDDVLRLRGFRVAGVKGAPGAKKPANFMSLALMKWHHLDLKHTK